jgi:hypothetical protein
VRVWFSYFVYGFYPLGERWRVDIVLSGAGVRHRLAVAVVGAAPRYRRVIFLRRAADLVVSLLHGAPLVGLAVVSTALWGGVLVTVVVATIGIVFSLPLGILLALGAALRKAGRQMGRGDVHRIRPRRTADHRPVHGERDAAAVRSRAPGARQARSRADRRSAVRFRLYGGGGARRTCGIPPANTRRRGRSG